MGKAPASQFYWGDLKRDVEYHLMSFEARGIWVEMLTCMWDAKERGKLEGTLEKLGGLLGCPQDKLQNAINEISVTKTGNVTNCNEIVTVINRRMFREEKIRKNTRLRVGRYREKRVSNSPSNGKVTSPSSSSSSLNNNKGKDQFDVTHEENPQKTNLKYYKNEIGNYVCSYCQKSFMQWQNLQNHFKEHLLKGE